MIPLATCALAAHLVIAAPAALPAADTVPGTPATLAGGDTVTPPLLAAATAPLGLPLPGLPPTLGQELAAAAASVVVPTFSGMRTASAPTATAPAATTAAARRREPSLAPSVPAVPAELAKPFAGKADSVVVEKGARRLTLYRGGRPMRSFLVALGFDPSGPKRVQGDGRTPEGVYRIDFRNPQSRFHRALHISYPSARDRAAAAALGRAPGGDIMIHGLPPAYASVGASHRTYDWTEGCVALTNEEIEEIWRAVPDGTPVEIKP